MDEALARTREQNDKENSDLANVKERAPGRQAGRRSRADRQRAKEERMMEMDDARPAGSSTARRLRRPRSRSRSLPAAAAPLAVAHDADFAMDVPQTGVVNGGSAPLGLASSNNARVVTAQSLAAPLGAAAGGRVPVTPVQRAECARSSGPPPPQPLFDAGDAVLSCTADADGARARARSGGGGTMSSARLGAPGGDMSVSSGTGSGASDDGFEMISSDGAPSEPNSSEHDFELVAAP